MVNKTEIIEKLKRNQGIKDDSQDELLNDIIDDAIAHYMAIASRLEGSRVIEVPEDHAFMITDVASRRYVRRGSEGMNSESVDGYQATYSEAERDFSAYIDLLEDRYSEGRENEGRVTFY